MADEKNLELKSVIAKFNQSSSALDALTERLSKLNDANNEISRAEQGISESHRQVKRVADEVTALSKELRIANSMVRQAMESVASFLNATELGAMKQGIDQILTSVNSQNQDLSKKVADGVKAEAELNSQIAALKSKIDAVPEKLKKKLGWIG
jgi:chromosome segregation ATPase